MMADYKDNLSGDVDEAGFMDNLSADVEHNNGGSPRRRSRSRSPRRRGRVGGFGGDRKDRDPRWAKRVILANIPYDCRWPEIKDLFKEKVGEAPYVEMFESADGKSRGIAMLEFKDPMTAEKAIDAVDRSEMKGRNLIVRLPKGKDKMEYELMRERKTGGGGGGGSMMGSGSMMGGSGGGSRMGGGRSSMGGMGAVTADELQKLAGDGPITNKVFVANLDYNVTESKIRDIFKMAGKVESVEMKNGKDGKFKGMCVVEFQYPLEAVQAISMFHNQSYYDRNMLVKIDRDPAAKKEERIPNKLPSGLRTIGAGLGAGGRILNVTDNQLGPLQNYSMGGGGLSSLGGGSSGMGSLGMGLGSGMSSGLGSGMSSGLSSMMRESDLFSSGGLADPSGMDRLGSMSAALTGLAAGGRMGSQSMGGQSMLDSLSRSSGGYGAGLGSGMSASMDRGSGSSGGMASSAIVVRNLPFSCDWKELKDRFRSAGDVVFAEIMTRGTGLVRFSSTDEARRAMMMMQGVRIGGREIDCSFDRRS